MHVIRKLWWSIRAILLKPFFGRIHFPSYIAPSTFIVRSRRIFIGKRVRIFPGLRAEVHGAGKLTIEDNVAIEQNVHITAMGELRIGAGTAVLGFVTITDIEHEYTDPDTPVLEQPIRYKRTEIGERCFIGMGARIQAGTVLGDGCIVGANAVVRGSFPAHSVLVGSPARPVKQYDRTRAEWVRLTHCD